MEKQTIVKANVKSESVKVKNVHNTNNLFCEACELDKVQNPASAFCVDCQDYLCTDCSSHHCIPKPTKHHKVLLQHEMPRRKVATSLSENCAKHKGETINFYCQDHQDLSCHTCITTMHRTCLSVYALTDFTTDVDRSPIYAEIKKELTETEEAFKAQTKRIHERDLLSRRCTVDALSTVRKRREEVNKQFDKLEQYIKYESAKMCREDTLKMKQLEDSCTVNLATLEEIKSDLILLEETKQNKQLFVAIKSAGKKIIQMKSALLKIKSNTVIRNFQLFPNMLSSSLAVREDSLGQLQICEPETDKRTSSIPGQVGIPKVLEMTPTKVVSTDYQRCLVVLRDRNFTEKGHIKLLTGPWDMTRTGENTVAVTLPHEKKIVFLYIEEEIQEVGQISASGHCRGIAAVNDKLVVTFSNPGSIKILSGVGEVIKDLPMKTTFAQLKEPAYVAVDEDKNIFVTDPVMNLVAKSNSSGCINAYCRSIRMPLHICVQNRTLFISECGSAKVHVLTPDFKRHDTEARFEKEFIGDFSISSVGVAFQGFFRMKENILELGSEKGKHANSRNGNSSSKSCALS